jgi:hypothetical protein
MTENKSLSMPLNIRCSSAESQLFQVDVILTDDTFPCEIQRNAFLISSNDNVAKSPFLNDIVATSPGIRLGQPHLQTGRCGIRRH